jgi:hypothetical protein
VHIHNVICTLTASDFTPKTEVFKRKKNRDQNNLQVEVGKHPQVILAMYFYHGQE